MIRLINRLVSFTIVSDLFDWSWLMTDLIERWIFFLSTSLCVFTLPGQSPCTVWWVWHAKQEMLTPRAPDLTFFWGFTLLHGIDRFLTDFAFSRGLYDTWLSDFGVCSFLDNTHNFNMIILKFQHNHVNSLT